MKHSNTVFCELIIFYIMLLFLLYKNINILCEDKINNFIKGGFSSGKKLREQSFLMGEDLIVFFLKIYLSGRIKMENGSKI